MDYREKQYQRLVDTSQERVYELGSMVNDSFHHDPRRIAFTSSRYKFVSKMLSGVKDVIEIGCADSFMSRIVLQEVSNLDLTDFDLSFVQEAQRFHINDNKVNTFQHDLISKPFPKTYDAAYALDVLEHISPKDEFMFMRNLVLSIRDKGICVLGLPSLESQRYASDISKTGHVNCKSGADLKKFMNSFFEYTFLFSMNDEVVHTGYMPMSHYLIAVSAHPKRL
jgi:2-polyprenyl-3-methyl-5-hydroxy-6-metoxy-1,4-benzoquinol methylase